MRIPSRPAIKGVLFQSEALGNLELRYAEAKAKYGVLPPLYELLLVFKDETPLSVTWSITDGLSGFDTVKENKIGNPSSHTRLRFEQSVWDAVGSNLKSLPERRLRIVCIYPTRSIEYLLLLET